MTETNLLVVDDNRDTCESLADILNERDYRVFTANTGSEAIAKARQVDFQASLIDIQLPDMDGLTLLMELKKVYTEMVVIIITGNAALPNAIDAVKKNANGYFVKPFAIEDVIQRLEEALEKQRLQRELKVSEGRYRSLVESATDAIITMDISGNIVSWNKGAEAMLGYTKNEVIGKPELFFMPGEVKVRNSEILKKVEASGCEKRVDSLRETKDGRCVLVESSIACINNESGQCAGYVTILRDMTEKKLAEEKLRKSKARFSGILDVAQDAIVSIDEAQRIIIFNKGAERIFGYSFNEVKGQPINIVIPERFWDNHKRHVENFGNSNMTAKDMNVHDYKIFGLRKGGEEFPAEASISQYLEDGGKIYTVVLRDITDRMRFDKERDEIQLKMMQNSKLASLGEIATGVAHEINQPLTYIRSFIQRLHRKLENDTFDKDKVKEWINTSLSQIARINSIIQHLRTFGRHGGEGKQKISIETVLNNTLLLIGERIRLRNIELKNDIEPGLPTVRGFASQLEQTFINLFQNAIYALSERSKDAEIRVDISISEDKASIIIKVADNGMGIKKENLGRIFDHFFTTKEEGMGTGIGLSIVNRIVKEHNGTITCESEVNMGSIFTITLPVA